MKIEQLAINSVSTNCDDLEKALHGYREAGFRQVEFCLPHVHRYLESHSRDDLRTLLEKTELSCIGGFEGGVDVLLSPDELVAANQRAIDNAALLGDLGATTMVVGIDGPGDPPPWDELLAQYADGFARLGEQIADTGVTICMEFNWSPTVKSLRTAAEIARRSDAANVGVLFDPAHYHCTPSKLEQLTPENVAAIAHVHVDDMRDKPGEHSDCNGDRLLPGEGCLPLGEMFDTIEKHGYDGAFSIEMFDAELAGMEPADAAARMYQSLLTLCD